MGGTFKVDLMTDVTHLIVGNRYTPKYEFAVKNRSDIVFLRPSAIPEIYQTWCQGTDLDFGKELESRKLGIFEDFYMCFTNIDSQEERKQLIELVNANGGSAHEDLNKNMTHLVTNRDSGKKCQFAKKWGLILVRPQWVTASIERGAALSETYFSLDLDDQQVGEGAIADWGALQAKSTSKSNKRKIDDDSPGNLRLARKSRVNLDSVWRSIIPERTSQTTLSVDGEEAWRDKLHESKVIPQEYAQLAADVEAQKLKTSTGLFSNRIFCLRGFNDSEKQVLENVITSHQGHLSKTPVDAEYLVVNSKGSESHLEPPETYKLVTEWMIERSLHKKAFIHDYWSDFVPKKPIPGFSNVNISISGFSGVELLHLERLIGMVGAQYQPVFVESRDLLISTSKSKKFAYALTWNVPIVNEKWLWKCAVEGRVLPLDSAEYVLDGKEYVGRVLKSKQSQTLPKFATEYDSISDVGDALKSSAKHIATESFSLSESFQNDRQTLYGGVDSGRISPVDDVSSTKRLVGRAAATSLTLNENHSTTTNESTLESVGTRGQKIQSSQVSYMDTENQYERNKLLEALGEVTDVEVLHTEEEMTPAVDLVLIEKDHNNVGRDRPKRKAR